VSPGRDTPGGWFCEQFALLLLGFSLGLAAGSLHRGVEVLLPAVGIGSCNARISMLFPRLRTISPRYGFVGNEGGTLSYMRKAPSGEGA
jgi:hypothetical protein